MVKYARLTYADDPLVCLQYKLGHQFENTRLLTQALTHKSHSQPHNERLEFLGDSVLNCAMAAVLYQRYPHMPEGELTRLRARLVCKQSLFELAAELSLDAALRLGEGESRRKGKESPSASILANALEALLGAIYLDAGFKAAARAIERLYAKLIQQQPRGDAMKDAKTRLQEWLQARRLSLPCYTLHGIEGVAHARRFSVTCEAAGLYCNGEGNSRRAAEQTASAALLGRLEREHG